MLSLLAYAVVVPMALVALVWVFGAGWPIAALVGLAVVGLHRAAVRSAKP